MIQAIGATVISTLKVLSFVLSALTTKETNLHHKIRFQGKIWHHNSPNDRCWALKICTIMGCQKCIDRAQRQTFLAAFVRGSEQCENYITYGSTSQCHNVYNNYLCLHPNIGSLPVQYVTTIFLPSHQPKSCV